MYFVTRLLSILAGLLFAVAVYGQIPRAISYQGILADGSGNLVPDGNHTLVLNLYETAAGGSPIYSETHTVAVVRGIFNAIIGSVTPIPGSLMFTRAYFLGVNVDGSGELSPRTALAAAPYAMSAYHADHAFRADTATYAITAGGGGGGGVTSLNTIDGAISLAGSGGTTIVNNVATKTITISSSGSGGTGIQGVQNTDGTLAIADPNGPTATINIANNAIGATKLATDIGSLVKVSGGVLSAAPAEVSIFGDLRFQSDDQSIIFPTVSGASDPMIYLFSGGTTNANRMIVGHSPDFPTWGIQYRDSNDEIHFLSSGSSVMNVDLGAGRVSIGGMSDPAAILDVHAGNGEDVIKAHTASSSGRAGYFQVENASSAAFALWGASGGAALSVGVYGQNSGAGRGGFFEITNASGTGVALTGNTQGLGTAGVISNVNSSNSATTLLVSTNGTGIGGSVRITNASNTTHALFAETNGTASTSHGMLAQHSASSGDGDGVRGETNSTSNGTLAGGTAGVMGVVTSTSPGGNSAGVRGVNNGTGGLGIGVVGYQAGTGWGVFGTTVGAGYAIYSQGDAYKTTGGNTWTIASDSRLKENIRPFTDGLAVIEQINPKRYYYNGLLGTRTENEEIGVIAEDMLIVAPYTVKPYAHPMDDGSAMDILTYNSGALTYVTINAVKELAAEVRALRLEIEAAKTLLRENGIDPDGKLPPVSKQ